MSRQDHEASCSTRGHGFGCPAMFSTWCEVEGMRHWCRVCFGDNDPMIESRHTQQFASMAALSQHLIAVHSIKTPSTEDIIYYYADQRRAYKASGQYDRDQRAALSIVEKPKPAPPPRPALKPIPETPARPQRARLFGGSAPPVPVQPPPGDTQRRSTGPSGSLFGNITALQGNSIGGVTKKARGKPEPPPKRTGNGKKRNEHDHL